uniref:Uncharacterized protein n=1 Tax=Molossus molossus TaxID=27622 RepID=A0A7J8FYV3_MOLMO|nr:hypothetical protein HJG59_008268 [Molossus molossus]
MPGANSMRGGRAAASICTHLFFITISTLQKRTPKHGGVEYLVQFTNLEGGSGARSGTQVVRIQKSNDHHRDKHRWQS